ncbi:MAG: hypothetical protein ABIB71_07870 [Candidatus Woesearchaeota archaeon]
MQKTTNEERKTAYQLKKLLGRKENQDLGDKSRWENIPVNYIVTANTLGIELNDYALKRLNEAEDKDLAFNSIYVANYFSAYARKEGKEDLAKRLEGMVVDENVKTEDIAFYATKAMENELPKDKVLEKIAKAYTTGKTFESMLPKSENKVESNNILDIVLIPTDKENSYAHISSLPNSLDNLVINIYSKGEINTEAMQKVLKTSEHSLCKKLEENIGFYNDKLKDSRTLCLLTSGLSAALAIAIPILATKIAPDFALFTAIAWPFPILAISNAVEWRQSLKTAESYRKEKKEFEEIFPKAKINCIKSRDLESAYSSAMSGKELPDERFEHEAVKQAISRILHMTGEIGVKAALIEAYQQQLKCSEVKREHELKMKI